MAYSINDLIDDILNNCVKYSPDSIIDLWFENCNISSRTYIPIFQYLRRLNRPTELYSEKLKNYIDVKKTQYNEFNQKRIKKFIDVTDIRSFIDMMKSDCKFERADLILYGYIKKIITEEEAIGYLNE